MFTVTKKLVDKIFESGDEDEHIFGRYLASFWIQTKFYYYIWRWKLKTLNDAGNAVVTKPYMKKVTTKNNFFDKLLAVTDETTNCEKCKIVYHTTDYEDNLTSEKHLSTEVEQPTISN